MTTADGDAAGATGRLRFVDTLDQLRAVVAMLVVYAHLVPEFLRSAHLDWPPADVVDTLVIRPLHAETDLAWVAVVIFFFISGFVVTQAAERETGGEFVIRRLLRIYPPVILAVLITAGIVATGTMVTGLNTHPTLAQWAQSATLTNFFFAGQPYILAVGWTLAIEVLFYLALWPGRLLLTRLPWVLPLALLALVVALVLLDRLVHLWPDHLAFRAAFLPIPIAGQIVYLVWASRIRPWLGGVLLLGTWGVLLLGMRVTNPEVWSPANGYLANVAWGFAIFVAVVLLNGRLRPNRALAIVARRSYSLYLLHLPVGGTVLALTLGANWPYPAGLLLALLATALATEIGYRFVELPSQHFGRRLVAGMRARRRPRPPHAQPVA